MQLIPEKKTQLRPEKPVPKFKDIGLLTGSYLHPKRENILTLKNQGKTNDQIANELGKIYGRDFFASSIKNFTAKTIKLSQPAPKCKKLIIAAAHEIERREGRITSSLLALDWTDNGLSILRHHPIRRHDA